MLWSRHSISRSGMPTSQKNEYSKRKPYNLTKALDYLKNLIVRESRKKKMKKDDFVNR